VAAIFAVANPGLNVSDEEYAWSSMRCGAGAAVRGGLLRV